MRRTIIAIGAIAISSCSAYAAKPTVVTCKFEKMPRMVLTFRGGMGADNNTLKVGKSKPVPLSVGSSMMIAEYGIQELTFSLRLPSNVTVRSPNQSSMTFYGECDSTLQP